MQAAKEDIIPDTMVFDHVQRMENFDGSSRGEYEKALKETSLTAFLGNVSSRDNRYRYLTSCAL